MNNLTEKILNKIKERGLNIRPRWHFILQTVGVILISALAFVLAVFLISWLYFILHANGTWLLPTFGGRGWLGFLYAFPWLPAIIGLVLIMILALALEKFRFAYRQPLLYLGLGIFALVVVFSFTLAKTPFHRDFYRSAYERGGGIIEPLYRGYGRMPRGEAYVGTVKNAATSTFSLTTDDGETFLVTTNDGTRFPAGFDLAPDDTVMVIGRRMDNNLTAFGVREINDGDDFFGQPRMMRAMMRSFAPR